MLNTRLATPQERQIIINFYVDENREDSLKDTIFRNVKEDLEKPLEVFFSETYKYWDAIVSPLIVVQDFTDYDAELYTFDLIFLPNEFNDFYMIPNSRIFRKGIYLQKLEPDHVAFDLEEEINSIPASGTLNTAGRPERPTDDSLLKAKEVLDLLSKDRKLTIIEACKNVGIPRASYYRASKWINLNMPLYLKR